MTLISRLVEPSAQGTGKRLSRIAKSQGASSLSVPLDEWNPFDVVIERNSSLRARVLTLCSCRTLRWFRSCGVASLRPTRVLQQLQQALEYCLTGSGRSDARRCCKRAMTTLSETARDFIAALRCAVLPSPKHLERKAFSLFRRRQDTIAESWFIRSLLRWYDRHASLLMRSANSEISAE